jgi:hypothetical protein
MSSPHNAKASATFFILLTCIAFILNWFWEMLQMPAYSETAGLPWRATAWRCTWATIGDMAVTYAVYGFGALITGTIRWTSNWTHSQILAIALISGVFALAIEWQALLDQRWHYSERMPIVPILDVGLWPLLQLPLLVPLSVVLSERITSDRLLSSQTH